MKVIKTLLFLCFFSLFLQHTFAQNAFIDSLKNEIKKLSPKTATYKRQKIDLLKQILENTSGVLPFEEVLQQIDTLAILCKELHDEDGYMEFSLQKKALLYTVHERGIEGLSLYRKYVEFLTTVGREKENGYLFIDIGNAYMQVNLYKSACGYYQKAIDIFAEQQNQSGLATAYSCYALGSQLSENFDVAAKYAFLAFNASIKGESDRYSNAYQRWILGTSLVRAEKKAEAKKEFNQGLQIFLDGNFVQDPSFNNLKVYAVYTALELGRLWKSENNIDSAQYYFQLVKKLIVDFDYNSLRLSTSLACTDMLYLSFQKNHAASKEKAQSLIKQFLSMPQNEHVKQMYYQVLVDAAIIYANAGDSIKMYEYGYKANKLHESLEKVTKQDELIEMNNLVFQMENEQTIEAQEKALVEKEIVAKQEHFFNQILMGLLLFGFLVLVIIGTLAWQLKNKNKLIKNYSEKLEETDHNKAILLSVIGHDLRAPFNTIFRSLQLINLDASQIELNLKKQLDQVSVASRNAFVLLDNLMQWISVQQEEFKVKERKESLPIMLKQIWTPLEALAISNQLTIQEELEVEYVECDSDMLQIILRNLIFNAIKYSSANAQILIKSYLEKEQVCFSIFNEGGQVPDDFLKEMNALQKNRHLAKKGGGLGLLLVQEIAQKLGMEFKVQNLNGGVLCTIIFRKNLAFEMSSNTFADSKIQVNTFVWTLEEEKNIQKIILKLQRFDIFETTELKKILEEPILDETPVIQKWKNQVAQAVYKMDEVLFKQLTTI